MTKLFMAEDKTVIEQPRMGRPRRLLIDLAASWLVVSNALGLILLVGCSASGTFRQKVTELIRPLFEDSAAGPAAGPLLRCLPYAVLALQLLSGIAIGLVLFWVADLNRQNKDTDTDKDQS